jgi:hypothetical protein
MILSLLSQFKNSWKNSALLFDSCIILLPGEIRCELYFPFFFVEYESIKIIF